jgi:mannose-6-phosphate isomerase class I
MLKGECWLGNHMPVHVHVHNAMYKKTSNSPAISVARTADLWGLPYHVRNFAAFSLESLKFEGM